MLSRRHKLLLLSLASLVSLSVAADAHTATDPGKLQIDLLQRLAGEGVKDASTELSLRAVSFARRGKTDAWTGFKLDLAQGVIRGDNRAMRQLAHLVGFDAHPGHPAGESLLLLALSSIRGNHDAFRELILLESMGIVSLRSLLQQLQVRLDSGILFDCIRLSLPCHDVSDIQWVAKVVANTKHFSSIIEPGQAQGDPQAKQHNASQHRLVNFEALERYLQRINSFNQGVSQKVVKTRGAVEATDWSTKQRIDRSIAKASTAQKQSKYQVKRFLKEQTWMVTQFVAALNQHRKEQQALTPEDFRKLLVDSTE